MRRFLIKVLKNQPVRQIAHGLGTGPIIKIMKSELILFLVQSELLEMCAKMIKVLESNNINYIFDSNITLNIFLPNHNYSILPQLLIDITYGKQYEFYNNHTKKRDTLGYHIDCYEPFLKKLGIFF